MERQRVRLELVGPALVDGAVAVGLEPELRDEQRLLRVAGSERVEERAERVPVVRAPAARVKPSEVVVEADRVERAPAGLACDARPAADRQPDWPGRVEPVS